MTRKTLNRVAIPILGMLFLFAISACKEENPTGQGGITLSGKVVNTTAIGVGQASVSLLRSGQSTPVATATTNQEGNYQLQNVGEGSFELRIFATGYDTLIKAITVSGEQSRVDTLLGRANVSGQILNSQTGQGIDSAEVSFTFGTDTTRANANLRVITNSQGRFEIRNAPTGTFVCVVRRSGFFTQVVNDVRFNSGQNSLPPSTIVPPPAPGSFRIVLTWGQSPSDLDAHLTGPDSVGGRFHCYYANMNPAGSNASLDVDDVSSFGPETITIRSFRNGMYRYSVHNYSNQSSTGAQGIFNSPTQVQVFGEQGLLRTYTAPQPSAQGGNTWRVFEIDVQGQTRTIRDVNVYVTANSSGDINTFRPIRKQDVQIQVE